MVMLHPQNKNALADRYEDTVSIKPYVLCESLLVNKALFLATSPAGWSGRLEH